MRRRQSDPLRTQHCLIGCRAGRAVAALFVVVRHTMPPDAPGTLTDQQSIDAIAHMFAVSEMPAGDKELPVDLKVLSGILIEAKPK